jgi:hypothetical protein
VKDSSYVFQSMVVEADCIKFEGQTLHSCSKAEHGPMYLVCN